ncbi:MAG TPA: UPF0158 family protein [Micromonosporaceae bacterium]
MFDLESIDLYQVMRALTDDEQGEHRWLFDTGTGQILLWTSSGGLSGTEPVPLEWLDVVPIDPLPPTIRRRDMIDFIRQVRDKDAAKRLTQAITGAEAERRFRIVLHSYPALAPVWDTFHEARLLRHAIEWLAAHGLIHKASAKQRIALIREPLVP